MDVAAPIAEKRMKPDNQNNLDSLRAWRVETPLPRNFKRDVWQRIAARQKQPEYWSVFADWILGLLARPGLALAYAVLVLVLGGGSGYLAGTGHKGHRDSELMARYVQTIDPYQSLVARP